MTMKRNKRQKLEGHATILEEIKDNQGRLSTLKSDLLPDNSPFPPKLGPYSVLLTDSNDSNGKMSRKDIIIESD